MKKFIAVLVFLIGALFYVAFAPFEPISFFSIGALSFVGVVWAAIYLAEKWEEDEK